MYDGTPRETIVYPPWLASDRTPLLAALLLIVRSAVIEPLARGAGSTVIYNAYILAGIVILSSWTIVLYRICRGIVDQYACHVVMLLAVTSPFFFFNTLYTWPKMLGATYVLLAVYMLLGLRKSQNVSAVDLTIVALCASLAYLSHASSGFALIAVALLFARTILGQGVWRIAIATGAAIIVALPWLWWQSYVQPGATALIRYALAGDFGFDKRDASILSSIRLAYQQLGLEGWIAAKLEGLQLIFGWSTIPFFGETATFSPGIGPLGSARLQDFYLLFRGIGVAVLGLPLLLASYILRPESRSSLSDASDLAVAGLGGIFIVWLLTLSIQITHDHAYGAIALVFLAGAIALVQASRRLTICALLFSFLYFGIVWIGHPLWIALRIEWSSFVAFLLGLVALGSIANSSRTEIRDVREGGLRAIP